MAVRAQERVGFPDILDEFAPPLGGDPAERVCGEVDVLLENYNRFPSRMNYVQILKLILLYLFVCCLLFWITSILHKICKQSHP